MALLKRWGFVAEHDGEYGPGPLSVQLAWGFDQSSFLIHEAQPDMAALAVASGETIGLLVAVKDQAVCLDMVESQHPLRCSFTGSRPAAGPGASAKSLLAFMPAAPAGGAGLPGRRGGHGSGAPVRELDTIRGQATPSPTAKSTPASGA